MDTGENKLYEAYKLNTKKKIDEFNEAARKIISDKEYPEAEDILKLVEGAPITDNHERRIHDPSIYKYHGRQVLQAFFDEPYPMPGVTIQRVMSSKYFLKNDSIPDRNGMKKETIAGYPVEWINGIGDPEFDTLTECSQNFKPQQTCDKVKAVFNILDADKSDRNGMIWQKELLMKQLMKPMWMIPPRHHKSWLWMKLLQMQLYEIQQRTLTNPPSTKWDINSVIHMRWPKPDLSDLKPEVGKIDDPILIDYINTFGPIDQMMIHSFMRHWSELVKLSQGPNLNDNKKALERVIKKGRKRK